MSTEVVYAAIYARYSSENQREASIEDQVRLCRALIEREGWTCREIYADHGLSGATKLRPGYQALLTKRFYNLARSMEAAADYHDHLEHLLREA